MKLFKSNTKNRVETKEKPTLLKRIKKTSTKVLIASLVIPTVLTSLGAVTAYANDENSNVDSNDRRAGSIQLGFQQQSGEGGEIESVSAEELRTIGIFLSNYYVPFSTEISNKSNSEEVQKESKEKMVKALTTNMKFSEDMAKSIVDSVFTVSSNAEPLYFATGEYQSPGKYKVTGVKNPQGEPRKAKFKEFLYQALAAETEYKGSNSKYPYFRYNKENNRGYLYHGSPKKDKEAVPTDKLVFNWNINGGKYTTASQSVLGTIYSNLNNEGTMGTSVFDIDSEKVKSDDINKIMESIIKEFGKGETFKGVYENSFYDWDMSIDAFGNILVDTGYRTYVAVPASMNPYIFKGEGSGIGGAIPINNLQMYSKYSKTGDFKNVDKKDNAYQMSFNMNPTKAFMGEDSDRFKVTSQKDNANWDGGAGIHTPEQVRDALITQEIINNFDAKGLASSESGFADMGGEFGNSMKNILDERLKDNYIRWRNEEKTKLYRVTSAKPSNAFLGSMKDSFFLDTYPYTITNVLSDGGKDYVQLNNSKIPSSYTFKYIGGLSTPDQVGMLMKDGKIDPSTIKSVKSYLDNSSGLPTVEANQYVEETDGRGGVVTLDGNEDFTAISANIYLTYVLASLYEDSTTAPKSEDDEEDKEETASTGEDAVLKEFGFVITNKNLPSINETIKGINDKNKEGGDGALSDDQLAEMQVWAYYFLHPTQGAKYLGRWFKTKFDGIMLNIHTSITGANEAQTSTGMTKYVGFSGYATMPNLSDMEWTQKMVQLYSDFSVYLIVFIVIIFVFHLILGEISFFRAVIGVLVFIFCLSLPPTVIQFSVDTSNAVSNRIFSSKFTYWALIQNQSYISKYNEVAKDGADGNEKDYVMGLMDLQEADSGTQGMYENNSTIGSSVTLKWMTPKKNQFFKQVQEELQDKTASSSAMSLLSQTILKKSLSGETYDPNTNAVYLYRSYADIGNFSRTFYGNTEGDTLFEGSGDTNHNFADYISSMETIGLGDITSNYLGGDVDKDNTLKFKIQKGFVNAEKNAEGSTNLEIKDFKRIYGPISSTPVSSVADTDISQIALGDKVGIENDAFKASSNNMNNHTASVKDSIKNSGDYSAEDLTSTGTYAMFTESPYYYFSWNLYDNGLDPKPDAKGNFKDLVLKDNSSYFYNYTIDKGQQGYGAMKDYLDMSSMFNVTIPYLKEANKPVKEWSNLYGAYPYKNVPSDDESASKFTNKESSSYYKYWHNNNLSRLYNQYTAWVDAMYDTDYAKKETIQYAGKEQEVKDPLDPREYKIRPMVFSESEMIYYGIKEYELTKVEKKIMEVQKQTRLDMLQLMNYYNFDDVVLNNAASMIATFNFNRIFSQRSYSKPSYELYPQNYELKNFTYDAYLRLILSEATGESILMNEDVQYKDLYQRVVEKGSILTGILIVINDILAQYVLPSTRWLALVMFFLLGIAILLASTLRKEISLGGTLGKAFVLPLFGFLAVNVLLSLCVSFFISNGITSVTGDLTTTVSFGDPTLTLFILFLLNIGIIALFVIILGKSFKNLISYSKLAFASFRLALNMVASTVGGAITGVGGKMAGIGDSSTNVRNSQTSNNYSSDSIENRSTMNTEEDDLSWSDDNRRDFNDDIRESPNDYNDYKDDFDVEEVTRQGRENLKRGSSNPYSLRDEDIKEVNTSFDVGGNSSSRERAEDISRREKIEDLNNKYSKKD